MKQNYEYDISVHDIVLATRSELDSEIANTQFELSAERGNLSVKLRQVESIELSPDERPSDSIVDWKSIFSVPFSSENTCECEDHTYGVRTKNGLVCSCKLRNCVVTTPHNGCNYIITGVMDLNDNSHVRHGGKKAPTYKEHFKNRIELDVCRTAPRALVDNHVTNINQYHILVYIYSINHASALVLAPCFQVKKNAFGSLHAKGYPSLQEDYDYESLKTLGDSFLKYAASQQLFKTNQDHREGPLTEERKKIISNDALYKFGCSHRLTSFIRKGSFNPKQWIIPGDKSKCLSLKEEFVSSRTRVYVWGRKRKIKRKVVADVVEALIGAFLSTGPGGEEAALSFINSNVDTNIIPYESHLNIPPEKLVDVTLLESLLNYSFQDPSLLVEALTHGSYKRPEVPTCYQRLEFLGDAVLDYLITQHFYNEYPDKSPGFLTVMRTISVNNECYALSAIKAKLHQHILHNAKGLDKQIAATVNAVKKLPSKSAFGWELETPFPDVLADVIESIAGAICVDSGYHKEAVFQSIRPLLEPLVTPETAKLHPVEELHELCHRENYARKEPSVSRDNGVTLVTIEVKAKGITHKVTATAANKKTAQKLASKEVLKLLKGPNFKSGPFLFPLLSAVFLLCWFVKSFII